MLVEFLNELLNEASPFYFYISWVLTLFTLYQFFYTGFQAKRFSRELMRRNYHASCCRLCPSGTDRRTANGVHSWITMKTKRKEAPEDDEDNFSFSFVIADKPKRGGKQWISILYSLSLRNIVLF